MTPDKHFNRWMKRALALFAVIFVYIVVTDVTIPMTSYATVQRPVISIAPQVSGEVIKVAVHNNQTVKQGDLLFAINPQDYQLAVQKAELELRKAYQSQATLHANIAEADANIAASKFELAEAERELNRLKSLQNKNMVSEQSVDQAHTQMKAAQANLKAAQAKKSAIQIALGEDDQNNLDIHTAQNNLNDAKLDLERTRIRAPMDGIVSNLQLMQGMLAQSNQALLSLVVSGKDRITADFREKSIANVQPGTRALMVFDALPGQVFEGRLSSRDFGIAQGQTLANGVLATPDDSDRWVRDAQRIRTYIQQNDETLPDTLISGSKATIMLMRSDSSILQAIGALQMHIVSALHYVY